MEPHEPKIDVRTKIRRGRVHIITRVESVEVVCSVDLQSVEGGAEDALPVYFTVRVLDGDQSVRTRSVKLKLEL